MKPDQELLLYRAATVLGALLDDACTHDQRQNELLQLERALDENRLQRRKRAQLDEEFNNGRGETKEPGE